MAISVVRDEYFIWLFPIIHHHTIPKIPNFLFTKSKIIFSHHHAIFHLFPCLLIIIIMYNFLVFLYICIFIIFFHKRNFCSQSMIINLIIWPFGSFISIIFLVLFCSLFSLYCFIHYSQFNFYAFYNMIKIIFVFCLHLFSTMISKVNNSFCFWILLIILFFKFIFYCTLNWIEIFVFQGRLKIKIHYT